MQLSMQLEMHEVISEHSLPPNALLVLQNHIVASDQSGHESDATVELIYFHYYCLKSIDKI
jgi:hypothetical protein